VSREAIGAWLAAREPAPPTALAQRLRQVLDTVPEAALAGMGMAEAMGTLGALTLGALGDRGAQAEGVALDLLAADAFVTYAFEAAAEEGTDVPALAQRLLKEVHA
jgi:hypothetical protein